MTLSPFEIRFSYGGGTIKRWVRFSHSTEDAWVDAERVLAREYPDGHARLIEVAPTEHPNSAMLVAEYNDLLHEAAADPSMGMTPRRQERIDRKRVIRREMDRRSRQPNETERAPCAFDLDKWISAGDRYRTAEGRRAHLDMDPKTGATVLCVE